MNKLSLIGIAALAAAIAVTVVVMLQSAHVAAGSDAASLLVVGWAISPYVCVLIAGLLTERFTRVPYRSATFCIVSVLMLAFTVAAYYSVPGGSSATAFIAFYAVPIDLFLGSFILMSTGLGISWALDRRAARSRQ